MTLARRATTSAMLFAAAATAILLAPLPATANAKVCGMLSTADLSSLWGKPMAVRPMMTELPQTQG